MTLKKFLKYFDDMEELEIMTYPDKDDYSKGVTLFKGYIFEDGANAALNKLYKEGWKLERNEDGVAVIVYPYHKASGAISCIVHINVTK